MRISVLTFGAIASILSINSVFATTSTVTSKDYVDAADSAIYDYVDEELANKQDLIETDSEYGWYNGNPTYEPEVHIVTTNPEDSDKVVGNAYGVLSHTLLSQWQGNNEDMADAFYHILADEDGWGLINNTVPTTYAVGEAINALRHKKADHMTCAGWPDGVQHTNENCWLWYKN